MLWYAGGRLQRWKFNYSNKRRGIMIDKCQYQLSAPKCVQKTANLWYTHRTHAHTHTHMARLWSRSRPGKTEQGHCASGASQVESSSPRPRPIWIRCRLTFSASASVSVPQCLGAFASECGGACLVCGADRAYTWFLNSYSQRSMCTLSLCVCVRVWVWHSWLQQQVAAPAAEGIRDQRPAIIKAA